MDGRCTIHYQVDGKERVEKLERNSMHGGSRPCVSKRTSRSQSQQQKEVPNLNNKTKYVVNHMTLKCYEKHRIKIMKVHRGIQYQERLYHGCQFLRHSSLEINLSPPNTTRTLYNNHPSQTYGQTQWRQTWWN